MTRNQGRVASHVLKQNFFPFQFEKVVIKGFLFS